MQDIGIWPKDKMEYVSNVFTSNPAFTGAD